MNTAVKKIRELEFFCGAKVRTKDLTLGRCLWWDFPAALNNMGKVKYEEG
jgi:hypothetical protein